MAKALADHAAVEQQTYAVNSSAEIDALLGFQSGIPQTIDGEWTLSRGYVDYMSGYIKLSLMYVSNTEPQKRISANMNLFTDIEHAAFAFEQTNDGQMQRANGLTSMSRITKVRRLLTGITRICTSAYLAAPVKQKSSMLYYI